MSTPKKAAHLNTHSKIMRWQRSIDGVTYTISSDKDALDTALIIKFLTQEAYWAKGRVAQAILEMLEHSLCFGLYRGDTQVGFARVVTDYYSFAYLADVFVIKQERGRGLGTWLVETILNTPPCSRVKTMMLFTKDAHGLYARFGFAEPEDTSRIMFRRA